MKINITNAAREELNNVLINSKKDCFKLVPGSRSCCDIAFTLMASDLDEDYTVYPVDEYKFLIEKDLDGIYDTIDVDYISEGFTRGFNIVSK